MATLSNQTTFLRYTLDINGNTAKHQYGWSEQVLAPDITGPTELADIKARGLLIGKYRSRCLPADHTIINVIANRRGARRKTCFCTEQQIPGKYVPIPLSNNGTLSLGTTLGLTSGPNFDALKFQSAAEFQISDPNVGIRFAFEAGLGIRLGLIFHGIPDFWINDFDERNLDLIASFMGSPPVDPAASSITPDVNYWQNWQDYFNFLGTFAKIVKPNGVTEVDGVEVPKWNLYDYLTCTAEGAGEKKVGRPFGLLHGRAATGR